MKCFYLCLALAGASVPAVAQAPTGSRALTRAEVARQTWPTFRRISGSGYVPEFAAMQLLLRNAGVYKSAPDGIFGPSTERAVKSFQRAKGLKADGVVGAQTWARLCPRLKRGDQGYAVRALQTLLNLQSDGTNEVKVDGVFGFPTEALLRTYQKNVEFKADGVVGAQMWALLPTPGEGD